MYLNYYKRTTPQPTQAELVAEYEKNRGIINTIKLEAKTYNNPRLVTKMNNGMLRKCYRTNQTRHQLYRTFTIPKRSGGRRTIEAPINEIKGMHRDVLMFLTKECRILPHNAAHGCVRNRNCKTALEVHKKNNSKWYLKIDFADAFGSIKANALTDMLVRKTIFATVSTYTVNNMISSIYGNYLNSATEDAQGLPQGSPLSPFLLNMYMIEFDYKLTTFCREHNLVYTRYVDDLLISGYEKFDKIEVLSYIHNIIPEGMQINPEKTRFGSVNWKNWNLGLMCNNEGNITVGYRKKKLMKNWVHNYNQREVRMANEYNKLLGLLNYYKYIEPEYFSSPKFELAAPNTVIRY